MPIAENFPEGLNPTGKINLDDGNFHIMWGPGKKTNTDGSQAEMLADADVVAAYAARGEEQVPLGVSGTMVAVDWIHVLQTVHALRLVQYKCSNGIEPKKTFQQKML